MRVKFQTAVLLREVGFDRETDAYFDLMLDGNPLSYSYDPANWNSVGEDISAPTLYEVFDWLLSKHIFVQVQPELNKWFYTVKVFGTNVWLLLGDNPINSFETYHEALEEGIIHALKQIK